METKHFNSRRLFCATAGIDSPGSLSVVNGRIVEVALSCEGRDEAPELEGDVLLPGLIDLHCHLGSGLSVYGVPSSVALASGVTMACSQGDAGARTVDRYVSEVIRPSVNKIKLAINPDTVQ